MERNTLPQFKGGEGDFLVKMFTDGAGKIMRGTLPPGCSIGYHKHEGNCEIIYILSGAGKCKYEDGEETLESIDDDEEFDAVADYFDARFDEEINYDN
jgi:quercetin dioxygenase-like cupin family protein